MKLKTARDHIDVCISTFHTSLAVSEVVLAVFVLVGIIH